MQPSTRFSVSFGLFLVLTFSSIGELKASVLGSSAAASEIAPLETESQKSVDELSREMINPLATITRFGLGLDHRSFQGSISGAHDQTSTSALFQAVIPYWQKNGKGWVFRFTLPHHDELPVYYVARDYPGVDKEYPEWLIRQFDPTLEGQGEWTSPHGHTDDASFDLAYGGVSDTGFILMYGLAGRLPTSSDTSNARQQLILGPEVNIGRMADWGTYGALISHVIDVVEKKDKGTPDTSMTRIEAYFSFNLKHGWQLVSSPTIDYDWQGDSGNKLAFPIGGGIAKTTKIGKMPLRVSAEIHKYVASTDRLGTDWLFKLNVTPVLPNKYTRY